MAAGLCLGGSLYGAHLQVPVIVAWPVAFFILIQLFIHFSYCLFACSRYQKEVQLFLRKRTNVGIKAVYFQFIFFHSAPIERSWEQSQLQSIQQLDQIHFQ